ncbi:hypothetical protein L227DRAFT_88709 [Lentinus tigrinus ALCF2SS1-6]|uniref:Uncharacterized protein n=1 Tax=Lentinus tigrinus ALCF2SS1-6 TaxID=1328759 RepID=A0A5C2SA02_9APHY|nr:hypothetical protein L227DRAFT_88709 [Lentinus tigrinus ALCF2SS1-6]
MAHADMMRRTPRSPTATISLPLYSITRVWLEAVIPLDILAAFNLCPGAFAQDSTPPFAFVPPDPSLTLCAPNTFLWTGGTPPFTLQIRIPSGQVSVLAELPFTNISAQHFTWTPDIEGTSVVAMLFDSNNATTISSPFSIQSTGNRTCSRAESQNDTAPIVMVDSGATARSTLGPGVFAGVAVAGAIVLAGALALFYWLCIANRNRRGFKRR